MVFDIFTLVEGLWLLLPAYAANGLAPLVKFRGSLHPVDRGKLFRGKPLLGQGKTWEVPFLPWQLSEQIHGVTLYIAPMGPLLGFLLGLGAMAGDMVASFFKRRLSL